MPAHVHSDNFGARARTFSERLYSARQAKGWSQERLAQEAGIARTYLQLLETNRAKAKPDAEGNYGPTNPTIDVVWSLADALDVSIGELLDR